MVKRALRASLCLDPRTKDLELVFKDGTAAELDLLLDGAALPESGGQLIPQLTVTFCRVVCESIRSRPSRVQ
jgi:hypothetical protein